MGRIIECRDQRVWLAACLPGLMAVILALLPVSVARAGIGGTHSASAPLQVLQIFGKGHQFQAEFVSEQRGSEVLVMVHESKRTYELLSVSGDCHVTGRQQIEVDVLGIPGAIGEPGLLVNGASILVLDGKRALRLLISGPDSDAWEQHTLTEQLPPGTFAERSAMIQDSVLHVVFVYRPDSARQQRSVYYLAVDLANLAQPKLELISTDWQLNQLELRLDIGEIVGQTSVLVARSQPEVSGGQLDLFQRNDKGGWAFHTLRSFRGGGPWLVHLASNGKAYVQSDGGGIERIDLNDRTLGTVQYFGPVPSAIDSQADLVAWVDGRRRGSEWWGRIPGNQILNPNTSPEWWNNNLFLDLEAPYSVTPQDARIEQAQIHQVGGKIVAIWLGYESFKGRAEKRTQENLALFCQELAPRQ